MGGKVTGKCPTTLEEEAKADLNLAPAVYKSSSLPLTTPNQFTLQKLTTLQHLLLMKEWCREDWNEHRLGCALIIFACSTAGRCSECMDRSQKTLEAEREEEGPNALC